MTESTMDLRAAFTEVSGNSSGGAPFLAAYAATFLITGVASFVLPRPTAALVAMFQGGVALPVAFWLERRWSTRRMAATNPLKPLSGLMAGSQGLGLPALIVVYSLSPGAIPVVLASLGGVHLVPYAWLHRTPIYVRLGVALAVGAFAIQVALGAAAFSYILLYVAIVYAVAAPLVYRHAHALVRAEARGVDQQAVVPPGGRA